MSTFSDQLPRSNESIEFLPLFHTCDGFDARKHMRLGGISTDDVCEVFEEKITYLFYGRAAYKYELTNESTRRLDLYPVCFIFDFELVDDIKRIYPFDSGAMHHGLFSRFMNEKVSLVDFELEPLENRVTDIVMHFYGSNEKYIDGQASDERLDPLDFESKAYIDLSATPTPEIADERRVSIEVQAGESLPFSNGVLKGMVVPAQYLDSPSYKVFRQSQNFNVRCYEIDVWNPNCSIPDDHIARRRSAFFMARWVLTEARDGRATC